jgi:AcrR family transcriptional regulator
VQPRKRPSSSRPSKRNIAETPNGRPSFAERARAVAASDPTGKAVLGERAMRTRDNLVETAIRLFLERGYGGTTIDDIAEAAGMSRASFYTYFPSKREILLLAGVRSNRARTVAISTIAQVPDSWTLEDLKNWVRAYLAFLDEYGGFQLVWSQAAWFDDELRALGVKGSMNTARVIGVNLQRLGSTSDIDPNLQGLAVLSMLDRFWYVWRKTQAPFDEAGVVDGLAGMLRSLLRDGVIPPVPTPRPKLS